ncbi:MAG: phytoene/squalene synthase family protein [Planctomycetota bacterium]
MSQSSSVAASYRAVRRIAKSSGSNFYRSFWLLPRQKRHAMCALYSFARITDDIGDCDQPADLRHQWLQTWLDITRQHLESDAPPSPVPPFPVPSHGGFAIDVPSRVQQIMPALRDTTTRYDIPTKYLSAIIEGAMADQQKTRFDTYEQLEHYCYLVASAVGLACMHIWGFDQPLPSRAAIDCGLAFQLTNILRDIREDADRGRIYLPRQHYEQHGLSEDDLLSPRADDRLRCLVLDEAQRAARLFDSGWGIWDSLHDDGKPMFSMMWRTYRRLLSRIESAPGHVSDIKIRLSGREKFGLITQHFIGPVFRRLPVPPPEVQS